MSPCKHFTHRIERLAYINSFLKSLGYSNDELPFKIEVPAVTDASNADVGLDKNVAIGPEEVNVLQRGLRELRIDHEHVEDHERPDEGVDEEENNSQSAEEGNEEDLADLGLDEASKKIEKTVESLVPEIRKKETTLDAFKRLTQHQEWIPFNVGGTSPLDREEQFLFASLQSSYNRHASPRATKGYHYFMIQWNLEAAERYRKETIGEEVQ